MNRSPLPLPISHARSEISIWRIKAGFLVVLSYVLGFGTCAVLFDVFIRRALP